MVSRRFSLGSGAISPAIRVRVFLPLMLLAHAALVLHSAWSDFVVVDEAGHIPSGLSHWQTGTFTAYRVNPPLPRMLAVIPVLAARPQLDYRELDSRAGVRCEWNLATRFAAM